MARRNLYISLPLVAALTILAGCEKSAQTVESGPRPVKSMTVRTIQSLGLSFPGVVQARTETDLAFRTLGRVISRKVDVGGLVHKDDVVAEIDPLAL
jgi:multidrug efflux pump subunit AcrA (membrane-fusion protein)